MSWKASDDSPQETLRKKYRRFHELLVLNNECLELLAGLRQDIQSGPPEKPAINDRVITLFEKAEAIVSALNFLSGDRYLRLFRLLLLQRREVNSCFRAHAQLRRDILNSRVLALNLRDPDSLSFRPGRCKSTHDVLCFGHERAIETMSSLVDMVMDRDPQGAKKISTSTPVPLFVIDLGGGIASEGTNGLAVDPAQVRSRPFRSLWRGLTHPGVAWSRTTPPSLRGFASVLAGALAEQPNVKRALGDRSYLLAAEEYMNLNARMAFHFSMVDACVSEMPDKNHLTFRFAGGGAARRRRNLRAGFIQAVLEHYGCSVDRRGDLVNAWFGRCGAHELEDKLDVLGRLIACAGQLDMYMSSEETAKWHAEQFILGNYDFRRPAT